MANRIEIYCKTITAHDIYRDIGQSYTGDSGLNLPFIYSDEIGRMSTRLIDLHVTIKCYKNNIPVSFLLIPRSSIYKTPLRLSNSIGLIDSGFNGTLKIPIDNFTSNDFRIDSDSSLFQIVFPDLCHNFEVIVHPPEKYQYIPLTERGEKEFGSSNQI